MVERMDIDALLIGSLYGELSAAEEARLQVHLESHPADRSALVNITQARAAFRDSQLATRLYDPPQSVSARLLQEAARRAPRKKAEEHREEGWFQRFLRSFVAHPAMAAATMLVLVLGVAGTLYLRGDAQLAEKKLSREDIVGPSAAPTQATPPSAKGEKKADGFDQGYRVGLDESPAAASGDAGAVAAADRPEENKLAAAKNGDPTAAANEKDRAEFGGNATASLDHLGGEKTKTEPPKRPTYLEVQTEHRVPKDLDDKADGNASVETKPKKDAKQQGDDVHEGENQTARDNTVLRGAGGTAGAAPGMVTGGAPAPAPTTAESAVQDSAARPDPRQPPKVIVAKPPAAPVAGRGIEQSQLAKESRPTTTPPPAVGAGSSAGSAAVGNREKSLEERQNDESLLAWARARHGELQTAVKNNQCQAAANLALDLATRAPGYYATSVEGDRQIKQCAPYIARIREADAERRLRLKRADESRSTTRPADAKPAPATNR